MKLHHPFTISSRLLPELKIANASIQLEYSKNPGRDGRTRYVWTIDIDSGKDEKTFHGNDLQSGGGGGNLLEGFQSLLPFLGSAGESFAYAERQGKDGMEGENSNLFPREVTEWAAANRDEIAMVSFEIEGLEDGEGGKIEE